jgi:hypothetical protein
MKSAQPHPSFLIRVRTPFGDYRPTPEEESVLRQGYFFPDGSPDWERTPKHVLDLDAAIVERETARMKAEFGERI